MRGVLIRKMVIGCASWPSVVHACRTNSAYRDDVIHVVRASGSTGRALLDDLEDAGFNVIAVGMLPSEIKDCSAASQFGNGQHLLIC